MALPSERTSLDHKRRIEAIVNGIEHVRMVVRSIVLDKIRHCIRDFFVLCQRYHRFAGDDLETEQRTIEASVRPRTLSHATVASSSVLPERVEPLGVWRRRRCTRTRRRFSFRRCPESPTIDICRREEDVEGRTTRDGSVIGLQSSLVGIAGIGLARFGLDIDWQHVCFAVLLETRDGILNGCGEASRYAVAVHGGAGGELIH